METSPSVTCAEATSRNDAIHTAAVAATSHVPSRVRRRTNKSDKQANASVASVSPTSQQLHNFEALPEYLQDNEFIQSGYRYNLPVKDTLRSFFNLHNETGNIWSHFIGFVLFAGLTVWMVNKPPTPLVLAKPHLEELWHAVSSNMQGLKGSMEHNYNQLHLPKLPNLQDLQDSWQSGVHSLSESVHSLQDRVQSSAHALADQWQQGLPALMLDRGLHWPSARWPMYVFCAGAMSCLLLSAGCHLFGCCKQHITTFIWRLDYAGIALLIVSSFYPTVYYSFLCQPYITLIYLVSITTLGAAAMMMSLLEVFQKSEWRHTRAGLYVALGLMGVVPLAHVMALHSDVWHVRTFVFRDVVMGACYIAGAAIYANRVPERWFPGKFDILLHSHQIFHLCVVLGAYLHWRACLLLLEWRDASGGCAVPVMKGPLSSVLDELSASGHDLLAIDQVWEGLRLAAAEHIAQLLTSASAGAPAGPAVA